MNQDKTGNLEKDMERIGFGDLIQEMKDKIRDREHLLLAYRDPGNKLKKMSMVCILDIRLHGKLHEYCLHNYSATMTKEMGNRSMEKYITCTRIFSGSDEPLPDLRRARQILQHDILRKEMQKAVRIEKKRNRKINNR